MDGTSVKKRVVIATVSTLLLTSPVELGLSDTTTARIPGTFLPGSSVALAAQQTPPTPTPVTPEQETIVQRNDAGAQLSQARKYMEPSEVLTEAELQKITEPYIGKTVSLADLYAITGAINNLYNDKGYMVCKAYLPPQRIHGGVVQIKLLEGKTGLVTLQGLKHTKEKYVTARVPLKPGTVANTAALNKQLQRFNGTNDVQLRILVHAGKEPGTTDYEIAAYEPKQNQSVTLYIWTITATRLRVVSAREYSITFAV